MSTVLARRRGIPVRTFGTVGTWVVLLVALAYFVLPIMWLMFAPTKTDFEVVRSSPFVPGNLGNAWSALQHVFNYENGVMWVWIRNSLVYSVGSLILTVVACIPSGYALACMRFRGRKLLLVTTLIIMFVPAPALVVPTFLEIHALKLQAPLSLILPMSFYPFGVYLTFIYFAGSLPGELLSAARIDGCNEWQLFTRIALPLARPIVALVAFFSFVGNWNNYFLPAILLYKDSDYSLPIGLKNLASASSVMNPGGGSLTAGIGRPEIAMAAIITVLPVLLIFVFSQRTLVAGLLAGSTKE